MTARPGRVLRRVVAAAGLLVLAAMTAAPAGDAIAPGEAAAMLRDLARPVATCVGRRDTDHAAFGGCIDWHSAVHGTWALIAVMRATGTDAHDELVRARLTPGNIAAERALLARRPGFEMPYGRAWFLRLAIDYRKRSGDGRLDAMAEEVADGLEGWLSAGPPDPWSGSYASESWALLNLLDYRRAVGPEAALDRARALGRRLLAPVDRACPVGRESGHFMAICTNLAALAVRVLPEDQVAPFLSRLLDGVRLSPVTHPVNTHHHGLNFSRAWGLWALWRATGEPRWRDLHARHVRATFERPAHWRGDYRRVGHWVAQFGVYALHPVIGPDRGR